MIKRMTLKQSSSFYKKGMLYSFSLPLGCFIFTNIANYKF